uniref:Purple acid phosphatase n=1 Tax=Oryza rufipogon TaxID=4529 RepID=A0A0E0RKH5_ORYRU
MAMGARLCSSSIIVVVVVLIVATAAEAMRCPGTTSVYRRPKKKAADMVDMPLDADVFAEPAGRNAPQQVHITLGDQTGTAMTVSWVTMEEAGNSTVLYGLAMDKLDMAADATYGVKYYYAMGFGFTVRSFWFTTPPRPGPDVAFRLGLIGDIGQTFDSNATLTHYEASGGDAVLFMGDLSYADKYPLHDNNRWDTWGRFSERSVAYQPWIWVAGNHEIDYAPELGETKPFKPFTHRYPTPHLASASPEPYWYSVKLASVHIIVLSSYSAFAKYTPQWKWLEAELGRVNRSETPWLIMASHSPWYNSNNFHYMEGESMRAQLEKMAVDARVDLVFAGHVHAYERSFRVSNIRYNITDGLCTPVRDRRAPVYVTIGDGGNIEGLADEMTWPQPPYSAFREDSFGHAVLDIKNRTHAYYAWYRNDDGAKVAADAVWFTNRFHMPNHDDSTPTPTKRHYYG